MTLKCKNCGGHDWYFVAISNLGEDENEFSELAPGIVAITCKTCNCEVNLVAEAGFQVDWLSRPWVYDEENETSQVEMDRWNEKVGKKRKN